MPREFRFAGTEVLIKRTGLIKRLQGKAVGDVGLSSITLAGLRHGVAKSERQDQNRAGHALSMNVILASHNTREFKRVKGLRVDDWLKGS